MAQHAAVQLPSGTYYPFLQVDVVLRRRPHRVTAIVDSGADRTVVPRVVVEALGVDYAGLKQLTDAAGSPVSGFGANGDFEIRVCRGKVRWKTTTICNQFWVADMGNKGIVLLGRDDYFKLYHVGFYWSEDPPYMDIEPV